MREMVENIVTRHKRHQINYLTYHGVESAEHGEHLLDLLLEEGESNPLRLQHLQVGAHLPVVLPPPDQLVEQAVTFLNTIYVKRSAIGCTFYCTVGWVNLYQKFEIEKYPVCGKLI